MPNSTRHLGYCLLLLLTALSGARAESFYQQEELFMFRPDDKKSLTTVNRFGADRAVGQSGAASLHDGDPLH